MRSEFSNSVTDNGYRTEPIPPRAAGPDRPADYEPLNILPAVDDLEGWRVWLREMNKAAGNPMCPRCDGSLCVQESGIVRGTWCLSCESSWMEEEILRPMVERLGRRKALSALLALAKGK